MGHGNPGSAFPCGSKCKRLFSSIQRRRRRSFDSWAITRAGTCRICIRISPFAFYVSVMMPLALHTFHTALHAQFTEVNGMEVVNDYGDYLAEHSALRHAAGVIDLSFRGRLVLT